METLYKTKLYQEYREVLICLIDLFIVLISYAFMFFVDNGFFLESQVLHITKYTIFGMCVVLVLHLICQLIFKTNRMLWTYTGANEVFKVGLSGFVCACIILSFSNRVGLLHASLIVISEALTFLLIMSTRLIYRVSRRMLLQIDRKENALIIGEGADGYLMLREIYSSKKYPFNVVGFLDDYKTKGTILSGKPVLGTIDELEKISKEYNVSQIFIAMRSIDAKQKREILDLCTATSINTKIMDFSLKEGNEEGKIKDINIEDLLNHPNIKVNTEQISSYLTDKTVCITGAGGSIGSELCRQIAKFKPKCIIMIDINENGLYMLNQELAREKMLHNLDSNIEIIPLIVSVREKEGLSKIFEEYKPDVVYHAAGYKHVSLMETIPAEAILNDVVGTKNVIDVSIESDVSRFILISSDKAINPINVMGASKRMSELILQSRKTDKSIKMAVVRFGNIIDSNASVVQVFKEQIKKGGPVTLSCKNAQRYFMTTLEAVQLVLQAGFYADKQEIFDLDMAEPVKIIKLAESMISLAGYVPHKDIEIQEVGLKPSEKMCEELALDIKKCSKTENDLIFVHDLVELDQHIIDKKVETLAKAANEINDSEKLKELLMDAIK